jgi:hypothetical protein
VVALDRIEVGVFGGIHPEGDKALFWPLAMSKVKTWPSPSQAVPSEKTREATP